MSVRSFLLFAVHLQAHGAHVRADAGEDAAQDVDSPCVKHTAAIFAAQRIGLVGLIGKGYRFISWVLIVIFVIPIVVVSIARPRTTGITAKSD